MTTILILFFIALFLLGLRLTRPARAPQMSAHESALFAQLESMERSLDATDRQFQKEQRQFHRELRKTQNPDLPPTSKKPRAPRQKTSSLPTSTPRASKSEPLPKPITLITPKPRINFFTTCTHFLRTTANYATSLLHQLFQLPRNFTSFFTRPPTPKSSPTISPSPRNHIA